MVANVNQVLTLNELKTILRMADEERDHDHMLQGYIYGAVKWFEKMTSITLVNRDFDYPLIIPYGRHVIDVPYTQARFRGNDVLPVRDDYSEIEYGTLLPTGDVESVEKRYLHQDRETVTIHIVKPTDPMGYYYIKIPDTYRIIPQEGSMLEWERGVNDIWQYQDDSGAEFIWQTIELERIHPQLVTDDYSLFTYGTLDSVGNAIEYQERIYLYHNLESFAIHINKPIDPNGIYFFKLPPTYELVTELNPLVWIYDVVNERYWAFDPDQQFNWRWQNFELRRKAPIAPPPNRIIKYYDIANTLREYEVPHDELVEAIENEGRTNHDGRIYLRDGWRSPTCRAVIPLRRGMIEVDENLKALLSVIVQQLYDGYIEIKMTSTLISLLKPYISMRI